MATRGLIVRYTSLLHQSRGGILQCNARRNASAIAVPTSTASENIDHDVTVRARGLNHKPEKIC